MSTIQVDTILNSAGTGSPSFPYGIPAQAVPLKLYANSPATSVLNIGPSEAIDAQGLGRIPYPLLSILPTVVASTIDFQTGLTTGGTISITFPSGTTGFFRRVGFTLTSAGTINAYFTAESATLVGVAAGSTLFTNSAELPLGWLDIQNSIGTTTYQSANSLTAVIANGVSGVPVIHQFTGGQVVNNYPQYFVNTEAQLTAAFSLLSGTGGIVCAYGSFTISTAQVVPSNVILLGRGWGTILTIGASGSISLGNTAQLKDLTITTALTSTTLVTLSGTFSFLDRVVFTVTANTAITCISVSLGAVSNRILNTRFTGISGTNTAISNSGADTQTLFNLIG